MAKRFGRPPSGWFSELNEVEAWLLDFEVFKFGVNEEAAARAQQERKRRRWRGR